MYKQDFSKMAAFAAIALSLTATSCSKDNESDENDAEVELRLSSGVEVQTRAAFAGSDMQIPGGQTVSVWVDEAGGSPQIYENNVLTANGSGSFSGGTLMYFPQNNSAVDIYAIHTNATLTSAFPSSLTHEVNADQRTLANYAPSDLLYAKSTNVAKTNSSVPLTFYHLLSKLQVAIVAGDGVTASEITGVTIAGMKLEAGFTLSKSTAPNAVVISASGSPTDISIGKDISTNFTTGVSYNDAIVVPQTLPAGAAFIIVHRTQPDPDLVYIIPAGGITFDSGKKYQYHITASLAGITLTSTISDWTPVNPVTGTAEIQ